MKRDGLDLRGARETLRAPVEAAVERARATGRRHYLALRRRVEMHDALDGFLASNARDAFYWQEPTRGISLLGLGRCDVVEASGPDRFARASARARDLFASLERLSLDREGDLGDAFGPLLVGGFAFYDREVEAQSEWFELGSGRLVLPELMLVCRAGVAVGTRTIAIDPDIGPDSLLDALCGGASFACATDPAIPRREDLAAGLDAMSGERARGPEIRVQADRPHGRYMAQVEAALDAIEAGKVEKVVVARSLEVMADEGFDLRAFLGSLREIYPACATSALRQGEHLFVCATPERLVSLSGEAVATAAVAGSAPRGRTPDEEAQYGSELLASAKERAEHEVVKRSIRTALRDVCGALEGAPAPGLLKLEGIQHLATPLTGRLKDGLRATTNVLDLVGRLHPTPAVGGAPRAAALDWLERFEGLDRGWYAGPIGHVDASGNGEFRVALRSGLLRGREARLFAGAGIVAGSDPRRELAETRLKLRALLAPLTEI